MGFVDVGRLPVARAVLLPDCCVAAFVSGEYCQVPFALTDSDRHDHDEGYPDLKLEFFTDHADQGTFPTPRLQ